MDVDKYVPLLLVTAVFMNAAEPPDILDRIRTAQSAGDFRQAANLYKQLIASGQDTPELRSNAAAMLHLSGQDGEALVQARAALLRGRAAAIPLPGDEVGEAGCKLATVQRRICHVFAIRGISPERGHRQWQDFG